MSDLKTYLGDFYREHILRGKIKSVAINSFKEAVTGDSNLKQMAKNRLDELNALDTACGGNLAKRCYISHVQRVALKEALDE